MRAQPTTTHPPAEFITAAQLRQRWKVSAMFLWRLRRKGTLRAFKFGERGVRYALADIQQIEAAARA